MISDFSNAKVGDKVFEVGRGWGMIIAVSPGSLWAIEVEFDHDHNKTEEYTIDGRLYIEYETPSLFWDNPIKEVLAPPVIEKSITVYANIYPKSMVVHSAVATAKEDATDGALGVAVPVTITAAVPANHELSSSFKFVDVSAEFW